MSSSTLSSQTSSTSSSSRPRSSWLQVICLTVIVYIFIFSTACCQAVPIWKSTSPHQLRSMSANKIDDDIATAAGGGIPSLPAGDGEFDSPESILERCIQASADGDIEENIFVKTLCTLALIHTRHTNDQTNHQGYVKRGASSDRSAFGAFGRFVTRLRLHADEVADYQEKLNRLQALGILDPDYNLISVPSETASLMKQQG
nr:uncharacterized protein LOC129268447 [Lytechinus pictus]